MKYALPLALFLSLAGIALSGPVSNAADKGEWPQFLGPSRNGISSETGLADSWPKDGPKEVWRVDGGVGMSGLAISRGKLLTMVQMDGKQRIIALDAKTGKPAWHTDVAPEFRNQMGNGPRATPTIAGEQVFVYTGEGNLTALSFADGKILWSREVLEELKGKPADYGMACSPLVAGNLVVVTVGAPKATVAAFQIDSGKPAWTAGSGDLAGYSSPALMNVGGKEQIVAYSGSSVLGITPDTGTVLWRYPYETDFGCNTASPLAIKGQVFVSSGENHGSVLLSLKASGDKFNVSEVWESQGPKSVLRNEWQTSILHDGHLYGLDNVGGAGPITHLTCVNAATGERVWQKARFGKGNLIAADGKLYFSMVTGELVMVKATTKGYEELGRATVIGATRQAPALAGGMIYLRDDQKIACFDVRK